MESLKKITLLLSFLYLQGCDYSNIFYFLNLPANHMSPKKWDTIYVQLNGFIQNPPKADWYEVDLFDTDFEDIARLRSLGGGIICYFSAGAWENWRPDAKNFKRKDIGRPLAGLSRERWLDIRSPDVMKIMEKRIKLAVKKGCDGIEPDNVNGHTNKTGFPLTKEDVIQYNAMLSTLAHKYGLFIGLKNAMTLTKELEPLFDYALNEQCHQYGECYRYSPFLKKNKLVYNIEYVDFIPKNKMPYVCLDSLNRGMVTDFYKLGLKGTYYRPCSRPKEMQK